MPTLVTQITHGSQLFGLANDDHFIRVTIDGEMYNLSISKLIYRGGLKEFYDQGYCFLLFRLDAGDVVVVEDDQVLYQLNIEYHD